MRTGWRNSFIQWAVWGSDQMKAFFSFVDTSRYAWYMRPMPTPNPPSPRAVERYLAGESLQAIVQDEPCGIRTLYRYMLKELGPEYYSVQQDILISKIADADANLDAADSNYAVARATAQGKFARFDLERRHPALYGPRQANQQVRVTIRDIRPVAPVLEVRPAAVLVPAEDGGDPAYVDAARESLPVGDGTHT